MRPPMVCDREAMYETIEALCADSMAGRRAASGGDLRAARMLAGMMEKAGCKPLWEEAVVPFHLENTMKALHTGNLDFAKRFFAGPWRDSTYNVTMVIRSGYPDAPKVVLGRIMTISGSSSWATPIRRIRLCCAGPTTMPQGPWP